MTHEQMRFQTMIAEHYTYNFDNKITAQFRVSICWNCGFHWIFFACDFLRLNTTEPRKSLDETDDADDSSDDERSYETPEEMRK